MKPYELSDLSDVAAPKGVKDLLATPEARRFYEERLAEWDKRLKPLIDANRRSGQITGDDLNIRIGPCD